VIAGLSMTIVAGKENSDKKSTPPFPNDKVVGSLAVPAMTPFIRIQDDWKINA
jgi:hypothetical protein